MKKFAYILLLFSTFILASCGVSSGRFKFEGKFLHMDQGEFYVYSPDGGIEGIDTIKVTGGRFTFECACKEPFTMMLVFPNFSEQPIFAESGKTVDVKADASHLKELTVTGTKTNELMNKFRELIVKASPPEERKSAEQFVKDHPESEVSLYLVRKYFIGGQTPDYKKVGLEIEAGEFKPNKNIHHTHEGSIGNLCNEQIQALMDQILSEFHFERMEGAEKKLLESK